jgi:hypothetical protein
LVVPWAIPKPGFARSAYAAEDDVGLFGGAVRARLEIESADAHGKILNQFFAQLIQ